MRCFIAVDLPEQVRMELIKAEEEIKKLEEVSRMKIVKPENLHITIKFLGELADKKVSKVKEVLRGIRIEPFKTKLNTLGVFPSLNYVRVVWVDVLPKEKLVELQQKIDAALSGQGFRKNRSFETHITLARIKSIKDREKFIEKIRKIKIQPLEFEVKDFVLKKSTLTKEGPIYEDIIKFELK